MDKNLENSPLFLGLNADEIEKEMRKLDREHQLEIEKAILGIKKGE